MPLDAWAGWFAVHPPDAPTQPQSDRVRNALDAVDEDGARGRVMRAQFWRNGLWFTLAPDADVTALRRDVV